MSHDNASQQGLWERAAKFGHASRSGKLGFNSRRLSANPRVSFGDAGPDRISTAAHEVAAQMNSFLGPLGLMYGPDGAMRAPSQTPVPVPQKLVRLERSAPAPAMREPVVTQDAVAMAFQRFGKAPIFKQAFTAGGKLRKGWTLVNGAPTWRGE